MATLAQIQRRIAHLQKQAETILARKTQSALDDIRELMERHGLTVADIDARYKGRKAASQPASPKIATPVAKSKGKLPPKYMNPKTGETWSGRARLRSGNSTRITSS